MVLLLKFRIQISEKGFQSLSVTKKFKVRRHKILRGILISALAIFSHNCCTRRLPRRSKVDEMDLWEHKSCFSQILLLLWARADFLFCIICSSPGSARRELRDACSRDLVVTRVTLQACKHPTSRVMHNVWIVARTRLSKETINSEVRCIRQ